MLNAERRYWLPCSITRSEKLNVKGLVASHRDEMFIELRLSSTTGGCPQLQAINISPLCGYGHNTLVSSFGGRNRLHSRQLRFVVERKFQKRVAAVQLEFRRDVSAVVVDGAGADK